MCIRDSPATTPVPLLAVDGNMDPTYDESLAEKSARRADTAELKVLYGVGHYPHVEDPPCVAEILRAHIGTEQR